MNFIHRFISITIYILNLKTIFKKKKIVNTFLFWPANEMINIDRKNTLK